MSSMLKKTGLSFKPKAGIRRPAAAAAKPPSSQAPAAAATAGPDTPSEPAADTQPPTQSQSHASTPAPTPTSTVDAPVTSTPPPPVAPAAPKPGEATKHASDERAAEETRAVQPGHSISPPAVEKPGPVPPVSQPPPASAPPVAEARTETVQKTSNSQVLQTTEVTTSTAVPTQSTTPAIASHTESEKSAPKAPAPETTESESLTATHVNDKNAPGPAISDTSVASSTALPLPSPSRGSESTAATSAPVTDGVEATGTGTEAGPPSKGKAAPRKRAPRKRKAPAEGEEEGEGASAPKPKRTRKAKAPANNAPDGQVSDGDVGRAAPTRKARRRRQPTPEDAENQRLDPKTTKVGELTKDLGIGVRFKHADVIEERRRKAEREARQRRIARAAGLLPDGATNGDGSRAGTPAAGSQASPAPASEEAEDGAGMVGYEIIDGQIVINQASLQVHQEGYQDGSDLTTVVEDDFTHMTNSSTWRRESRATGPNQWTEPDTERFYDLLEMWGTDFETISHMLPGKTRRHVKLKFSREERLRPNRVNAAIKARGPRKVVMDLDAYKTRRVVGAAGGSDLGEWQDKDKILEDQRRLAAEHEKELEALRKERREAGLLDEEEGEGEGTGETGEAGEAGEQGTTAPDEEVIEEEVEEEVIEDGADANANGTPTTAVQAAAVVSL